MDALSKFLLDHAPLALFLAFIAHLAKDFVRDFLSRDAAAKLADNDPSNDKVARLEQAGAVVLDKIPDPSSLIQTKK